MFWWHPHSESFFAQALSLLNALKLHVLDIASITPTHYLAMGEPGVIYFQSLLTLLIDNVNLAALEELNAVWAVMLHKERTKPNHLARSWRYISTCPLLAKAMYL